MHPNYCLLAISVRNMASAAYPGKIDLQGI